METSPAFQKRVQTLRLDNGLEIELLDGSRKLAGDRYKVTLVARIRIPVRSVALDPSEGVDKEKVIRRVGESVIFEKKMERHFIDQGEKDALFDTLKASFLSTARAYLAHPEFAKKYVLKVYQEAEKKRRWPLDPSAASASVTRAPG